MIWNDICVVVSDCIVREYNLTTKMLVAGYLRTSDLSPKKGSHFRVCSITANANLVAVTWHSYHWTPSAPVDDCTNFLSCLTP